MVFEVAELVGTPERGIYRGCICGVCANGGDSGCLIETGGYAVVEAQGGMLTGVRLGVTNAHFW